jgi:acetate kinase
MEHAILCLNAGSSSLKFAVYRMEDAAEERVFSGAAEEISGPQGKFWLRGDGDRVLADRHQQFADHGTAVAAMFAGLAEQGTKDFIAAGHRIVHGGPFFSSPQKVDVRLRDRLQELVPFAPLHLPSQIAIIDELSKRSPELPQVACFDTAFHRNLPDVARRFALPQKLGDEGVLRYGFHGLSYEFVVSKLGADLGRHAIIAHLGNGASMVALRDGAPVDTSMGLTPTGGFMMGTRSGDLDPGVILYLLRQGWTVEHLERLVDRESGLLGVSGLTSDMRTLLEKRGPDTGACLAVEMFCYQVRKFIGAYAAVLGGLDTLVFTAGIGERAAEVRAEICHGLEFLGVELDAAGNARHAEVISRAGSACTVRVVATDEDLMIARHTRRVLLGGGNSAATKMKGVWQ